VWSLRGKMVITLWPREMRRIERCLWKRWICAKNLVWKRSFFFSLCCHKANFSARRQILMWKRIFFLPLIVSVCLCVSVCVVCVCVSACVCVCRVCLCVSVCVVCVCVSACVCVCSEKTPRLRANIRSGSTLFYLTPTSQQHKLKQQMDSKLSSTFPILFCLKAVWICWEVALS
jgi:hypothetical protein